MWIWKYLFSMVERRNWWLRKMPNCPLRDYYEVPFPDPEADWRRLDYLALDFETTGLDQVSDEILSVGYVPIRGQSLRLGESGYFLAKPTGAIPEDSAVVHGILDDEAASAQSLEAGLPELLHALAGRVMVAHYAAIEYYFLNEACKRIYGYPYIGPVVDTLSLEVAFFRNRGQAMKPGDLRLANTRARYNLPRYPAHNALTDAIAAGELFLAQLAHRNDKREPLLKELTVAS